MTPIGRAISWAGFLLLSVCVFSATADEPKIHTGKGAASAIKFAPFTLVELQISETTDKDGLLWEIEPVRVKDEPPDSDRTVSWASGQEEKKSRFVAPPGPYTATVTIVSAREGGGFRVRKVKYEFEILPPVNWKPTPPPTPPDVVPPAPTTFAARVKAALAIDPDAALAPSLVLIYQEGEKEAATASTYGELFSAMTAKATALGFEGKMLVTQAVVVARIKKDVPWQKSDIVPIADADRKKVAAVFAECAAALK